MKKILLIALLMVFGMSVFAQSYKSMVPKALQNKAVLKPVPSGIMAEPLSNGSFVNVPRSSSAAATIIGGTRYDAQTNSSMHERIYFDPGANTIGGIWTRGMTDPGYADRGTGYNYYNGSAWGPNPSGRIEAIKTGWPCYQQWNGGGEIVVSHNFAGASGLIMNTRLVAGTGTWTSGTVPPPPGGNWIVWPAMITAGADHNTIHILALTPPAASGGTSYQGLDGAIVYYRSTDGGANWDKNGIIIDPMNSSNYIGFSADEYTWGSPHGDTICFVVGGNWLDTFLMTSYDNGETWTKTEILSNSHKAEATTVPADPFYCCDGSLAVEMDKEGVFHVAFGRMRASSDGSTRVYYYYTDGLIYWNSTMPQLQDSLIPDTLYNHGQLLGWVYSNAAGDPLVRFPYYGVSLTSFPQITVDACDHLNVIWSGVTVGNPYVGSDSLNYRHIWERHSVDHGVTWSDSNDLNHGLAYIYKEYAFPSMAKNKPDNYIRFVYQSADVPGSAVRDATNVIVHNNTIEERKELTVSCYVGINDDNAKIKGNTVSPNMPNPCKGLTTVNVTLVNNASVSLDVYNPLGMKVMSINKGRMNKGEHSLTIDGSRLSPGIYLYTVKINNENYSNKLIIE
ncbi:MAG: T9SS type A sorting domain-containing protein [Bacteroidetes bacterium]|nr:T9SS type A sorting domain-containing protein [Bacteroidota bacterium]